MPDTSLTAVREILIHGQGLPDRKVTPDARILHDLGVDGDDAADVFQAIHERFGTDFVELEHQWKLFFNAEGVSPRALLIAIPAIIVCACASGLLVAALHWPVFIAAIFALVLFIVGSRLFARRFGRRLRPLTVSGLAEIVQAGRWPANPFSVH